MDLISDIPEHFQCVISSKRNIGKSFLAKYLVYRLIKENPKRFSYIRVFSNTAHINEDWSFLPDNFIKKGFQDDIVQTILKFQEKRVVDLGKEHAPSCLLIFDDVIGGNSDRMAYSDSINQIFTQGRHYKISSIFCLQYSKSIITPSMRNNIDLLFLSKSSIPALEGFYDILSSHPMFEKMRDLKRIMLKLDTNLKTYRDGGGRICHESKFLFFNNTSHASTEKQVMIVKAKAIPSSFRIKIQTKKAKGKKKAKDEKKEKDEEEDEDIF